MTVSFSHILISKPFSVCVWTLRYHLQSPTWQYIFHMCHLHLMGDRLHGVQVMFSSRPFINLHNQRHSCAILHNFHDSLKNPGQTGQTHANCSKLQFVWQTYTFLKSVSKLKRFCTTSTYNLQTTNYCQHLHYHTNWSKLGTIFHKHKLSQFSKKGTNFH